VYLALDGHRSVHEVAGHLRMKPQNVTRELRTLKELGLVDVADLDGNATRYTRKFFDSIVGLSDALAEKFGLDPSGLAKDKATAKAPG
jgi:predicted transcriptional regulator